MYQGADPPCGDQSDSSTASGSSAWNVTLAVRAGCASGGAGGIAGVAGARVVVGATAVGGGVAAEAAGGKAAAAGGEAGGADCAEARVLDPSSEMAIAPDQIARLPRMAETVALMKAQLNRREVPCSTRRGRVGLPIVKRMVARPFPLLLLSAALVVSRTACAEPPPAEPEATPAPAPDVAATAPPPAGPLVPVRFRTDVKDGALRVQGPGIAPSGGDCAAACTMSVAPGQYTLYLSAGGSVKSFDVYVRGPSDVVVSGPNGFHKGLALALLIGGGTVFTAGGIVLYTDLKLRADDERYGDVDPRYRYRSPDWVVPVEIAGAVGGVVTVVGVVLYLTARTSVEVLPRQAAADRRGQRAAARPRFTFVPTLDAHGGSVSAGFTF
jgi:hypothetical protein